MGSGWFCGLWCVCSSPGDVLCAYAAWIVIALVSATCQALCIPHIESERWRLFHVAFANVGTTLAYCAHARAMYSDPGFVPKQGDSASKQDDAAAKPGDAVWCDRCNNIKPEGAHHCRKCGKCIQGMDHHCPWTNNCVGPKNIKFFLLFLLYVGVGCLCACARTCRITTATTLIPARPLPTTATAAAAAAARSSETTPPKALCFLTASGACSPPSLLLSAPDWLGLLTWRATQIYHERLRLQRAKVWQPLLKLETPGELLPPLAWLASCLFCMAFLVFVCAMWTDQYEALVTATPLVDAMKLARRRAQERRRKRRERIEAGEWVNAEEEEEESEAEWMKKRRTTALIVALSKACGERPHLRWLLPLKPPPGSGGAPQTWGRGLDGCVAGAGSVQQPQPQTQTQTQTQTQPQPQQKGGNHAAAAAAGSLAAADANARHLEKKIN